MNYNGLNDYELLSYVSENDESASGVIFEKYMPLIYDRATRLYKCCTNYGVEVKDLVQEGMLGLNDAINNFNDSYDTCFYTYALKCINSRIISCITKAGRVKNRVLNDSVTIDISDKTNNFGKEFIDNSYNPEKILINEENESEILKIIDDCLSENEKQVINLKINGFNYREIAEILEKPVKVIDNTLQRAKSKIRERLNEKV